MANIIDNVTIMDLINNSNDYHNELYFKPGEVWTAPEMIIPAHVTTSRTQLQFSIVFPKSLKYITSWTVTHCGVYARRPAGGYLFTGDTVQETNLAGNKLDSWKSTDYIMFFSYNSDYAINYSTNNTPISMQTSFSITFN